MILIRWAPRRQWTSGDTGDAGPRGDAGTGGSRVDAGAAGLRGDDGPRETLVTLSCEEMMELEEMLGLRRRCLLVLVLISRRRFSEHGRLLLRGLLTLSGQVAEVRNGSSSCLCIGRYELLSRSGGQEPSLLIGPSRSKQTKGRQSFSTSYIRSRVVILLHNPGIHGMCHLGFTSPFDHSPRVIMPSKRYIFRQRNV